MSSVANPSALLNALPDSITTPELQLKLAEGENFALIQQLQQQANFAQATEVNMIDGLRVEYADGFGLVRASNTTPCVIFRFEADSAEALERIQQDFRQQIFAQKADVALPF